MEATQAYLRGDGQAAKLLSQYAFHAFYQVPAFVVSLCLSLIIHHFRKGREHDERVKEYFDRAADQIFAPK